MAELADAADSKSAGTWYLGGSTPPPGTSTLSMNATTWAGSISLHSEGLSTFQNPTLPITLFILWRTEQTGNWITENQTS